MRHSDSGHEIPYPVDRALDALADQPGIWPLRVHHIGVPLHVAQVSATVQAREAFDLLDRYVGLAITDGELRSVAEISGFLGITADTVRRVLRFLGEIGHVTGADGALALTPLGLDSARDDTRYTPKEDRSRLYFDGVRGWPLPSRFYARGVRLLDHDAAFGQHRFRLFKHETGFSSDAVTALAARQDRADYNLPDEHENPQAVGNHPAYLPCYIITAATSAGYRLLAFSAADAAASDPHLEEIFRSWHALNQAMLTEDGTQAQRERRSEMESWLKVRGLSITQSSQAGEKIPRLALPARHFPAVDAPVRSRGEFPRDRVGSYVTPGSTVLQLWCEDPGIRRDAALERALPYATPSRHTKPEVTAFLAQLSARLDLPEPLTLEALDTHSRQACQGPLGY